MTQLVLPNSLTTLLEQQNLEHQNNLDKMFSRLMPTLADVLNCGRCFLYLRNPETQVGKVAFCWRRDFRFPDVSDPDWKPEPPSLPHEDPLFAAALRTDPSVFVKDVETASPDVVNVEFERKYLGHRALVHAHLCHDGRLWGILQPSVFDHPRIWTESDRAIIHQVVSQITPLSIRYVRSSEI